MWTPETLEVAFCVLDTHALQRMYHTIQEQTPPRLIHSVAVQGGAYCTSTKALTQTTGGQKRNAAWETSCTVGEKSTLPRYFLQTFFLSPNVLETCPVTKNWINGDGVSFKQQSRQQKHLDCARVPGRVYILQYSVKPDFGAFTKRENTFKTSKIRGTLKFHKYRLIALQAEPNAIRNNILAHEPAHPLYRFLTGYEQFMNQDR